MNEKIATIYTDGATEGQNGKLGTVTHCGLGVYIECLDGYVSEHSSKVEAISNNEAEFMALILGMKEAVKIGITRATFYLDSQIVVNRAKGSKPKKAKFKNPRMDRLQWMVHTLHDVFEKAEYVWIPREQNTKADELSKKNIKSSLF